MLPTALALAGLAAGVSARPLLNRMRSYASAPTSLADSVQWGLLTTPGIVWNKDGSFMGAFSFQGPDLSFATPSQSNALAMRVKEVLRSVGERQMISVDAVRIPSRAYRSGDGADSQAADLVSRLRRRRYESGTHYETHHFISFTYQPPPTLYERAQRFFYKGGPAINGSINWDSACANFEERLADFSARFPERLRVERLRGQKLLSYLNLVLTGRQQSVTPPRRAALLDFLFADVLDSGFEPHLGGDWVRVVSVQGYPEDVAPGATAALESLDFPYRYSTRCIGTAPEKARKVARRRLNGWAMKRKGAREQMTREATGQPGASDLFTNLWADKLARDAQEVLQKLASGQEAMLHTTQCVIVRHPDYEVCNQRAMSVEKALSQAGLVARRQNDGAVDALLGSFPGHGHHNVRRYPILSEAVARLLPLTATYPGPESNPCTDYGEDAPPLFHARTRQHAPFRFTPYVGDVGHQMIIGPTGAGKSILMGFQALRQLQYEGGQAILLDSGNSFAPLCEAVGGARYDAAAAAEEGAFQPLRYIDQPAERQWAGSWVLSLARLQGLAPTPSMRALVAGALTTMSRRPPGQRTIQELKTQVQHRQLKAALAPYAGDGSLGMLLNASSDAFEEARFHVIELGELLDLDEALVTPILLYLFHRIEGMLAPGHPTFVGADEFFMFAAKSPVGREYAQEAMRTYRKKNAALTIATQAPSDVVGKGLASILSSCRTRLFLPNPDALDPAQHHAYEQVGLTGRHIQVIAKAEPKKEYLSVQPRGARLFDLGLRQELAFLAPLAGKSLLETARQMRRYKKAHAEKEGSEGGVGWAASWVRDRGFSLPAGLWEELARENRTQNSAVELLQRTHALEATASS